MARLVPVIGPSGRVVSTITPSVKYASCLSSESLSTKVASIGKSLTPVITRLEHLPNVPSALCSVLWIVRRTAWSYLLILYYVALMVLCTVVRCSTNTWTSLYRCPSTAMISLQPSMSVCRIWQSAPLLMS